MKSLFAAMAGLVVLTGAAAAQSPVAVVEDVEGKVTGAEFMDYVAPGTVIKIGAGGKVVLGYMKSCRRETITGIGTVIVGPDESMVHLSDVDAGTVPCDSSHSQLVDKQVRDSAASVVRGLNIETPQLRLYGLSPIVETRGRGELVVERLDISGERYHVNLTPGSVTRGRFYDFARTNTMLTPGATYAASLGSQRLVFVVDPAAAAGRAPVIGRLVKLQ